jgi:hypothetical protein
MPRLVLWFVLAASAAASALGAQNVPASPPPPLPPRSELVVLVHGMGRTARSMEPLRAALDSAGFDVINVGYSSLCCSIPELGEALRNEVATRRLPAHTRVHFVGHSLGNILVRWVLTQPDPPPGVGRVVMLAPPNQGSHSADRYSGVIGWLLEPIAELRTDSAATVRGIPPVRGVPIGIIAARHDGKLTVDETRLPEAQEHVVVDGTHTFIMRREAVHRLTIAFLRDGSFGVPPDSAR